jgi:RND family efflux transporter MFP subunit
MSRFRLFVALVLAAALPLAAGCKGSVAARADRAETAERARPAREVQVVAAREDRLVRAIAVTGTLAAEEQVTLSMKVTGRLDALLVDLGSRVSKGQVVARLIPTDFSLRVKQADAALQQGRVRLGLPPHGEDDAIDVLETSVVRQARALLDEQRLIHERIATFVKRGISAKAELDAADAALKVAEGRYQDALEEVRNRQAILEQRRTELELARQALRDSSLTSPLDGMVRERHTTVGQYLAVGSPVVTIVRMHPLRLRLAIPERESLSIRVNQDVAVTVEGDPTKYPGRIARISPAIDEASRTLMVEAEVPNPDSALRPGAFANAEVITAAQARALLVPASAIVTFAGVDKVLIAQDNKAVERPVALGRREGDRVEIVSGLAPGEAVIVQPGNLVQGEPIRIAPTSSRPTSPAR